MSQESASKDQILTSTSLVADRDLRHVTEVFTNSKEVAALAGKREQDACASEQKISEGRKVGDGDVAVRAEPDMRELLHLISELERLL